MPIPPPQTSIPYDLVDVAMNFARVALNDCPLNLSGNLLTDIQPYAQTIANLGWRMMQEDLDEAGEPAMKGEIVLHSLPAVTSVDPSTMVFLNQAEYFDGTGYWMPPAIAVLPQNFMSPRWIRERLGGTTAVFTPMEPCDDGLPGGPKTTYMRTWQWQAGFDAVGSQQPLSIWMPGATVPRDLWINFAAYLPDFQNNIPIATTPWYQQPIPLYRCADALGFYIAAAFAYSRGSIQANATAQGDSFRSLGKERMRSLMNRTGKIRQRINHRRRSYSRGKHAGWSWW
jgi:hypothetical protein